MRGKLRDKRVTNKRENSRREGLEHRRPYKRDSRAPLWINDPEGDDDDLIVDIENDDVAEEAKLPLKK
jgi:hypothetical protein